jgi:hypothetical protein
MIKVIGSVYNLLQHFTNHYLRLGTLDFWPHYTNPLLQLNCQFKKSQSQIATDGQSVSKSWCRAPSAAHDPIFITLWQLRSCFCGVPSLTRGRVCLSYMMLVVASVVLLGSECLGTRYYLLLSQIWDFPFRRFLRLAGSRWRYSNPPPHGCGCKQVKELSVIVGFSIYSFGSDHTENTFIA